MNIEYPFNFDSRGRTATTDDDGHIRDMLEQLLLTNPGERVNRPDFGSGLLQMIFAPNSPELAATLQMSAQAAIQRWLGDLIELQSLVIVAVALSTLLWDELCSATAVRRNHFRKQTAQLPNLRCGSVGARDQLGEFVCGKFV